MLEPFSKRAQPWERHGTALRQLAGVSPGALLDPWQLAPKVGLRVMDGDTALALLPEEDRLHLCGPASRSWSGGVLPLPLPDGSRLCILNPRHQKRRNKITLMEEITHSFLHHKPTKITLRGGTVEVRDYDATREAEAYGAGAAALIPWTLLFRLLNQGTNIPELAERFEVSEELAEYRIKITGAYRLFQARQRYTA
ncbi:MAG: ImmA/IrrE family metallo-endopeptidase [Bryobacteraceae bacterium]